MDGCEPCICLKESCSNETSSDANTLGLIAGVAAVDWGLAIQIGAAASIGSDMQFIPTTAQI